MPTHSPSAPAEGRHKITLIPGDGIGVEVSQAAARVVEAAGVDVEWEACEAGATVFERGLASGVPKETIDSVARTRVALKGPLETPVGFGGKSANVTLRKLFELYGNVRPTRELPGIQSLYTGRKIDFVVVRENVEDLYAGIEHMQTPGVAQCLKLMSWKGCEKITRLAFELAHAEGRKKVHCATKANIMKMTEGLMKRVCETVAAQYPEIQHEHIIIDNCAHQLVRWPEQFEIIVTSNLNGDIISDLAAGLTGGLGIAPSANIGNDVAMFEAVHGSAPQIAGKDIANPTAMILSAVMMLRHIGEFAAADKIEHAIAITLEEEKAVTIDLTDPDHAVGTRRFTDEVIANLGRRCDNLFAREYRPMRLPQVLSRPDLVQVRRRRVAGIDIFIEFAGTPAELGASLERLCADGPLKLKTISNRGACVYPGETSRVDCVDHFPCRFMLRDDDADLADAHVVDLLQRIAGIHRWMHIEKLSEFDGERGYSLAQGED
ncbi:MAG: NADP-dependent isocitrate dehydrogenase [Phycisphaerae bacterium]